jgi:serine phosphatase RsbU (regulator of sigma subunit)
MRGAATGRYRWFSAHAVAVDGRDGEIAQWIAAMLDVEDEVAAHAMVERLLREQTAVAESYQRASLPANLPWVEGVRFSAEYRASSDAPTVGGDWFDAFTLPGGGTALMIGDIAGHGLQAAIKMNRVRHSARTLGFNGARLGLADPAAVLDAVEQTVLTEDPEFLATAIFGVLDAQLRTFSFASAGHPPPLVRSRGGVVREVAASGMPLGCAFGPPRVTTILPLDGVETIVLYTDGVIEGTKDTLTGLRALAEALRTLPLDPAEEAAREILRAMQPTDRDDAAVLAIRLSR